jgi:hypothetical protein
MWNQYKKTAKMMQSFIFITCVSVFFLTGRQPVAAVAYFVVMQGGALFGAAWAARLKARTGGGTADVLPLARR